MNNNELQINNYIEKEPKIHDGKLRFSIKNIQYPFLLPSYNHGKVAVNFELSQYKKFLMDEDTIKAELQTRLKRVQLNRVLFTMAEYNTFFRFRFANFINWLKDVFIHKVDNKTGYIRPTIYIWIKDHQRFFKDNYDDIDFNYLLVDFDPPYDLRQMKRVAKLHKKREKMIMRDYEDGIMDTFEYFIETRINLFKENDIIQACLAIIDHFMRMHQSRTDFCYDEYMKDHYTFNIHEHDNFTLEKVLETIINKGLLKEHIFARLKFTKEPLNLNDIKNTKQ